MALRVLLVSLLLAGSAGAQAPTDPAPTDARRPAVFPPAVDPGDTAWAYDVRYVDPAERRFLSFPINAGPIAADGPAVQAPDGALIQGCDFDDLDVSRLVCVSAAGGLFSLDLEAEAVAPIGAGSYGGVVADLTYSVADDAWYALVSDCGGEPVDYRSSLARVDPATGAATAIGAGAATSFCGLGLAADRDGALFAYSAETPAAVSRLAQIDPATGAFEIVGPTGIGAFYAQSMDCDAADGRCYAFAYEGNGFNGVYQVSTAAGAFGLIGELPEGAEMSAAAIATSTVVAGTRGPDAAGALRVLSVTPARDRLRLAVGGAGEVEAFDALGRRVARVAARAPTVTLDVTRWAPGVYVLRGGAETLTVTVAR